MTRPKTLMGLNALGLRFLVEGVELRQSTWDQIELRLTVVLSQVVYEHSGDIGSVLYIDEVSIPPDANGWVFEAKKLERPYWLKKAAFEDYRLLEQLLHSISSGKAKALL